MRLIVSCYYSALEKLGKSTLKSKASSGKVENPSSVAIAQLAEHLNIDVMLGI
jgi:hypothetical protein